MNEQTKLIKDELSSVPITRVTPESARKAEVVAMLHCGGGLVIEHGVTRVEAVFDSLDAIRRLRGEIASLYGITSTTVTQRGTATGSDEHLLRQVLNAEHLARRSGLIDPAGRPVVGMPTDVVSGTLTDAAAALRGAFLAQGSFAVGAHRRMTLRLICPTAAASLAMIGFARRHGVKAKMRQIVRHGQPREAAEVRDAEGIRHLLTVMGAPAAARTLVDTHVKRDEALRAMRLQEVNQSRAVDAALRSSSAVEHAVNVLGGDVPEHLAQVAALRLANRTATLHDLGRLAEPPLSKDTVAGRIKTLLRIAERHEEERGRAGAA